MVVDANGAGAVDYEPNSCSGPVEERSVTEPPLRITGDAARYGCSNDDEELYRQFQSFGKRCWTTRGGRT